MAYLRGYQAVGGKLGKIDCPRSIPKSEGGFKEFEIRDIFEVKSPLKRFNANAINLDGGYPYVVRTSVNNGIKGYTTQDERYLCEGGTISFGQDTATIFFQENPYFTGDKIKVMKCRDKKLNPQTASYLLAAMRKSFSSFNWGVSSFNEDILNDVKINLPVNLNGSVDFNYMQNVIENIENDYGLIISNFLESNGYLDCTLTDIERQALTDFSMGYIQMKDRTIQNFRLGDLFEGQTGDVDLQQSDINGLGEYFINSGVQDCGIKGRTSRKAKIFESNTITIDFFGNANYRSFKYKMATHNHVFSLSGDVLKNENVGLYIVSQLSYLRNVFSYNNMGTWPKIKQQVVSLPIDKDGNIDYDFMENYINALKKQCIARLKVSNIFKS